MRDDYFDPIRRRLDRRFRVRNTAKILLRCLPIIAVLVVAYLIYTKPAIASSLAAIKQYIQSLRL